MANNATYRNLWSRFILKRVFELQFLVPRRASRAQRRLLRWYERRLLNIEIEGIDIDRPIFLIGMHRSGTTLLQDVLCAHPDVAFITNVMNAFPDSPCAIEDVRRRFRLDVRGERFLNDGVEVGGGSANEGVVFWERWLKEDPYDWSFRQRTIDDFSPEELEEMRRTIRRILWSGGGPGKRFLTKNPRLVPHVRLLAEMFPEAKFIHLVRDPRMCANSMVKFYRLVRGQLEKIRAAGGHGVYDEKDFMPYPRLPRLAEYVEQFGAEDIRTAAHLWNDGVASVAEAGKSIASFHQVRHEDVLAQPVAEVEEICRFCELPLPDKDVTAFWKTIDGVDPSRKSKGYENFELIESICREKMQEYGYL